MQAALTAMQRQLTGLAAAQQAAQRATFNGGMFDDRAYRQNVARMDNMRRQILDYANAGGAFRTQSVNLTSATSNFNEALANNKLRLRDVVSEMRGWRKEQGLARRAYREQLALQNAVAANWGADNRGRTRGTLFIPNETPRGLESIRSQMSYINRMINSAAENTIKWGKNTQWAGRQLMVGFTYPIALIGAGTAALAYQYEKEMSRIIKVSEESSAVIRKNARDTAEYVAGEYGKSGQETLKVMGDLAAIGYEGSALTKMTQETQRISFLGDLNPEDASKLVTILQTVYGMDPSRIKQAGDYMNALENATSLTMDDFVKGAPRIAAIMEEMGVSFEQMGVLLNGFKSAGIDAEEGARALRSVAFRTIAPRGHVLEVFEKNTGKDLKQIIQQYKGEFLPTFMAIGNELKNIDSIGRSEVVRVLFGVEQGSKALELMNQLVDQTGQMGRAWGVAQSGAEAWAETAERETKAYQENVANRFKIALEQVKLMLVDIGTPFLELGTRILEGIKPVVDFFMKMPDWVKKTAMFAAVAGLLLGPIIMLAGLFANAAGNIVKAFVAITSFGNRMKIVNAEQRAAALLAQQSANANTAQATTVDRLRMRTDMLTASIRAQIAAMGGLTGAQAQAYIAGTAGPPVSLIHSGRANGAGAASAAPAGYSQTAAGRWRNSAGRFVSGQEVVAARAAERAAAATAATANQSAAASRNWGGVAQGAAAAALAAGIFFNTKGDNSANQTQMLNTLMGFTLLATLMPGLAKGAFTFFGTMGRSVPLTRGLTNGIGAALGKMNPLVAGAIRFLGPIGVIAGGILLLKEVYDYMTLISNRMNDVNNSAESWSEVLGYEYKDNAPALEDQKDTVSQAQMLDKAVAGIREKNKGLVDYTSQQVKNQTELTRLAKQQAALVINSGGTEEQAEMAAKALLVAADASHVTVGRVMFEVEQVDWANPQAVANEMGNNFSYYFQAALKEQRDGGFSIRDLFQGEEDLKQAAGEQANFAGQAFAEQFASAAADPEKQKQLLEGLDKTLEDSTARIMNDLKGQSVQARSLFTDLGISGAQAFISTWEKEEAYFAAGTKTEKDWVEENRLPSLHATIDATNEQINALRQQAAMENAVVDSIVENLGLTDEQAKQLRTVEGLTNLLGLSGDELTNVLDGQADALTRVGEAAHVAGKGMEWLASVSEEDLAPMLTEGRKSTMSYAADYILDSAADAHQNNFNAAMDALRARGDAEMAQFDRDADALEDKYDKAQKAFEARWDEESGVRTAKLRAIRDEIKAEEKANEIRERIFEAEKRRIERLAALYNNNIDFNTALNSGNLDEAAKIQSNTGAQVAGWAMEDQRDNDPAKARLESLKAKEEAEEKALDRAKEREQEALRAAQDADKAALESAKKLSQDRIRDKEQSAQRMFDIEKKRLDRELAILRQFIPTNEAELKNWEARARAIYDQFGSGYLEPTSTAWGNLVGDGLEFGVRSSTEAMKNDIQWAAVAKEIADQITGVLGLDAAQFMQWMKTGVLPGSTNMPYNTNATAVVGGGARSVARHSGGPVSWSSKDRTGVPRSASLYPSETMAILKKGEFVVNKRAAQKNLGLLHHINENKVANEGQVLHTGGSVGMGGGAMAAGLMAGVMRQVMSAAAQQLMMGVAGATGGGSAGANMLGEAALGAILKGLRMQESGGNYKARSKISSASGAYQYIKSTWGNYGGFREAWMAPPEVQDRRASADLMNAFRRYGNWEQAIASHFYPAWAGNRSKWGEAPGKGNPTVWDYVMGVLSKSGFGAGMMMPGMAGGAFSSANGAWPPAVRGKVSANTAAAANFVRNAFGINSIGLLGSRPNKSDHPMGKAADFMIPKWNTPQGIALGNQIASYFVQNPNAFGTKYVIWRDMINKGNGWTPYTHPNGPTNNPTLQHRDHVHLSVKHPGGEVTVPGLKVGGDVKYDNTIANLHKGERVLTAPLARTMDEQLKSLADGNGGGNGDTFHITVDGTASREDKVEVERIVRKVLDDRDRRNGNSRRQG